MSPPNPALKVVELARILAEISNQYPETREQIDDAVDAADELLSELEAAHDLQIRCHMRQMLEEHAN